MSRCIVTFLITVPYKYSYLPSSLSLVSQSHQAIHWIHRCHPTNANNTHGISKQDFCHILRYSINVWLWGLGSMTAGASSTFWWCSKLSAKVVYVCLSCRLLRISESCLWLKPGLVHNLIVRIVKSEAKVTNNKRLCSRYRTVKLTTDRHEASHGLSATAELLATIQC